MNHLFPYIFILLIGAVVLSGCCRANQRGLDIENNYSVYNTRIEKCPVIYGPAGHVDGLRKSVDEPWFCSYSLDVREKENYYFMWNGENWFFHFYRDVSWSYTPVMI
jgi:hypothetical protein